MTEKVNIIHNNYEFESKKIILSSTPQYITLGTHWGCNAKCIFCLGGNYPTFSLEIYKNFFEKKLYKILKNAQHIGFCGYGEVLLMPGILEFLDYINTTLPDVIKVFTTNGEPLNKEICNKFSEGKYSILISLHASNKKLHKYLTGKNYFEKIIDNIKYLSLIKGLHINLIFLITRFNIEDLPEFIKLARILNVDRVTCNYLTIFSEEQLQMSCFFEKDKTNKIFDEAEKIAKELDITLILPPRFGNKTKKTDTKIFCDDPWKFFYVEVQGSVLPCCFAGEHIGYLNKQDFLEIWNSKGYTDLRKGLVNNKPHIWCKNCYRYNPENVDNINSHITFRPVTQKKILEYLKQHADEFFTSKKVLEL